MIQLTRLQVFREVARRRSFTAAASALGYAQPSISNQIAQLEREVGTRLVERSTRRLVLTPAGEVLAAHVEAVLVRLEDLPLATLEEIPLDLLAAEPFCAPPRNTRFRAALELACRLAGYTPRVVSEANGCMAMQGLVAAGVGISVMPRLLAAVPLRPG